MIVEQSYNIKFIEVDDSRSYDYFYIVLIV